MKILAVDTSAGSCSVAVTEDGVLSADLNLVTARTHSRHLMGMVESVLDLSGNTAGDMDGFAVTRGPGSFTGLRIGLSVVKGLCFALNRPVVGISVLDALAWGLPVTDMPVHALLDARKGEVYAAEYAFREKTAVPHRKGEERVLSPEAAIEGVSGPALFVGPGARAYEALIREKLGEKARFAPNHLHFARAAVVAALANPLFEKGTLDDVGTLSPHYIRKSEAELNFGKKKASGV